MTTPAAEAPVTPANLIAVQRRLDQLIAEGAQYDEETFLGAQFDAGLAWVQFPMGSGGLGVPASLQLIVDKALMEADRSSSWMRNPMGIGQVAPTLAKWGTAQQQSHLRAIFTASEIWCQLFSEPGAGSDIATLATRAVPSGEGWLINGQKVWTTRAHLARYGLLLARTDPDVPKHRGLSAFVLDMQSAGVEVRPLRQMTGHADFNEVYLSDVWIPDSARIGPTGQGWSVALTTLTSERAAIGADASLPDSGPLALLLDAWATSRLKSTIQRDAVARMRAEAEILRWTVARSQVSSKESPLNDGSILKLARATLNQNMANLALELLGPKGMLVPDYEGLVPRDDDVAITFLFGPAFTIAGGTTDIVKGVIAERVLGLPRDLRADKELPWTAIPRFGNV
jgi:alkylation response protein AidB-like acyl-CoA dehydrogenase